MEVSFYDPAGQDQFLGTAATARAMNSLAKKYAVLGIINVRFDLGIPLQADVIRLDNEPETVVLNSDGVELYIERSVGGDKSPEHLGVSCKSTGDVVPVDTINLPFRPYDDPATTKGIVWVRAGDHAFASLHLRPTGLQETDTTAYSLIEEARDTVRKMILNRFLN